ncbi:hypothetical protein AMAG_03316 [Allomyces macrogynus ATCC 38327]|uniref:Nudix hydrolase domain-containing protein n=1 Tax=Allomyces macrogynus (strain ATCC 38327) TaxID=578462 RepID=A0A0L0S8R4_ALLM3|nr:hypothetical protein AMAG_03316 [Allomyces macrogynus ATCC 38327]|eukprot:KNE58958.1 hypothetical protein AMAG_03316 [Allomyces macrogynus ATCC 38327]
MHRHCRSSSLARTWSTLRARIRRLQHASPVTSPIDATAVNVPLRFIATKSHRAMSTATPAPELQEPHILRKSVIASANWVSLKKIEWVDPRGVARSWETAERTTRSGDCDAVAILALLKGGSKPTETVLTLQYRPPVDKLCVELPAGLIDKGETAEEAAVRELKEETGYHGNVVRTTGIQVNDPGLTNANMKLCILDVDRTLPDNRHPVATPEDGEFIDRRLVPVRELLAKLEAFQQEGLAVDARLMHLAIGLNLSGFLTDTADGSS